MTSLIIRLAVLLGLSTASFSLLAAPPAGAEEKVEALLVHSGIKKQYENLSTRIALGINQTFGIPIQGKPGSATQSETIGAKAFPPNGFTTSIREALLQRYDEKLYDRLIAQFQVPLVKRTTLLEMEVPSMEQMQAYAKTLQSSPPGRERNRLIEEMDNAWHASEDRTKEYVQMTRLSAIAALGNCPSKTKLKDVDKMISAGMKAIESQSVAQVRFGLSMVYRTLSDAELAEYLKIIRTPDYQVLQSLVRDVTNKQMAKGLASLEPVLREGAAALERQKSVFLRSADCAGKLVLPAPGYGNQAARKDQPPTETAAAPSESAQTQTPVRQATRRSRANEDARECLKHDDVKKLTACTEQFR